MNYQEQALAGATGIDLVVALYDGWMRFLYRAIKAVEADDVIDRRYAVKRALDINMYLEARLRPDIGGAPAASLSDFYAAMFNMTLEASHTASKESLLEVVACVRNVRDAWAIAARDPEANRVLPRELRTATERTAKTPLPMAPPSASTSQQMRWSA